MQHENPDEFYIIELILAKHPYLRPMVNARIPGRILGIAVLAPAVFDSRNHVPVLDDELRRFVREWLTTTARMSLRTCHVESDGILCLVPLQ